MLNSLLDNFRVYWLYTLLYACEAVMGMWIITTIIGFLYQFYGLYQSTKSGDKPTSTYRCRCRCHCGHGGICGSIQNAASKPTGDLKTDDGKVRGVYVDSAGDVVLGPSVPLPE
jgi:hypothetical protein